MSGKDSKNEAKTLRKENKGLRNEVDLLREQVKKLEEEIRSQQSTSSHLQSAMMSSDGAKTVEYVSDQCDDMVELHSNTLNELKVISSRLDSISKRCKEIEDFVDHAEDYSYQYNVKIVGMPMSSASESAEATTALCLRLFSHIGAKSVSILDIDIAHRVPSRKPSDKPNAIVCRFTRRLARSRVLECRKSASNVTAEHLGFDSSISVEGLMIFEHLSPRQQALFQEAKRLKDVYQFKFCWAKGGMIWLRKSDDSDIFKLRNSEDLAKLTKKLAQAHTSSGSVS